MATFKYLEDVDNFKPETRVKFPEIMKYDGNNSGSFVDVRTGCCICSRGFASTMDVRPSTDYYNNFTSLSGIDFRMPYYNCGLDTEVDDDHYIPADKWFVWTKPDMEYVYLLRNMLRILHERGLCLFFSGVSESFNFDDEEVKSQVCNYYGSSSIPDPTPETVDWDDFNFVNAKEITLCPGCYSWSAFIYPQYYDRFVEYNNFGMAYRQWLDIYGEKLIIENIDESTHAI
ncbi:Hypothetical protein HVR_LOCUS968 [uncultured virus]|nr:Hypothetical protein HVR_LOCUS968 [uncultured virus]